MPLVSSIGVPTTIGLVEVGRFSRAAARVVAANLLAVLGVHVETLAPLDVPVEAFLPARRQYDARLVLKFCAPLLRGDLRSLLVLTEIDLCSPILTYVYGEAELGGRLAVVSTARLGEGGDGEPISLDRFLERLVKVALHETAHTLSLYHCETPACLMRFSPGIRHLDGLDLCFCTRCEFMLRKAMGNGSRHL